MKIEDKRNNNPKTIFEDIKKGDCFQSRFSGYFYIKITELKAVRLEDGEIKDFCLDCGVDKVNAKIIIGDD